MALELLGTGPWLLPEYTNASSRRRVTGRGSRHKNITTGHGNSVGKEPRRKENTIGSDRGGESVGPLALRRDGYPGPPARSGPAGIPALDAPPQVGLTAHFSSGHLGTSAVGFRNSWSVMVRLSVVQWPEKDQLVPVPVGPKRAYTWNLTGPGNTSHSSVIMLGRHVGVVVSPQRHAKTLAHHNEAATRFQVEVAATGLRAERWRREPRKEKRMKLSRKL
ncbi:hypothetical protein EDB84DRAFT_1439940 [Lactarius hengduanensis]|nr:hypothetical protein EDB84DRAFT_1439940 [Lactarius hengduanensis]